MGLFSSNNYVNMIGKQLVRFICRQNLILLKCCVWDRANRPGINCVKHATARGMRHGKAFETTEVREKKDLNHKFPVEGKGYI